MCVCGFTVLESYIDFNKKSFKLCDPKSPAVNIGAGDTVHFTPNRTQLYSLPRLFQPCAILHPKHSKYIERNTQYA